MFPDRTYLRVCGVRVAMSDYDDEFGESICVNALSLPHNVSGAPGAREGGPHPLFLPL